MPDPDAPDLFAAAGINLPADPAPVKPKRQRKAEPPTAAERAAAVRLVGGRRSRGVCPRDRVGAPRDLSPRPVVPYPLAKNAKILSATVERLPHFYDDAFEKRWAKVGRSVEERLLKRGIRADDALACANELLEAALDIRATQAEMERRRG